MEQKPTVAILMSTYNGEKFLREQLDSIFAQEEVNVKLFVRDDGSSDQTLKILKKYDDIYVIKGENIGCEESFKTLLYLPIEADYYAFSDQDDIWHKRKLISSIRNITKHNADLSVCNLMIADADMNLERPLFSKNEIENLDSLFKKHALGNLHGCVQVWTKKLHNIIQEYYPTETFPHDVWVNVIANLLSSTCIDSDCYINYRLHGNNSSGYARSFNQRFVKGIKRYLLYEKPTRYDLCNQLIAGYGKYTDVKNHKFDTIKLISKYKTNFRNKVRLLTSKYINERDFEHRCLDWICILINKY